MKKTFRSKVIAVDLCNTIAGVTKAVEELYGRRPDPAVLEHPDTPNPFWADPGNRIAREIFRFAEPYDGAVGVLCRLARRYQMV